MLRPVMEMLCRRYLTCLEVDLSGVVGRIQVEVRRRTKYGG